MTAVDVKKEPEKVDLKKKIDKIVCEVLLLVDDATLPAATRLYTMLAVIGALGALYVHTTRINPQQMSNLVYRHIEQNLAGLAREIQKSDDAPRIILTTTK